MPLRKRKPTSPARRFQTVSDFREITKARPEKSLLAPKPGTGGRKSWSQVRRPRRWEGWRSPDSRSSSSRNRGGPRRKRRDSCRRGRE